MNCYSLRNPPARSTRVRLRLFFVAAALGATGASSTGCDDPLPPVDGPRIFVTSTRQNADLGGIEGADALCAAQALDAGLDGEFRAWLSTLDSSVAERLDHSDRPYYRVDGQVIAENWDDLIDGTVGVPIDLDANGEPHTGDVWTGTLATGESYPGDDCAGFTSAAVGNAQCGDSESASSTWTQNITPTCSVSLRLYCVEQ